MTVGLKATVAASLLDALFNAANYTAPVGVFLKLHTGDPGAAGTSNAAGNTTRQAASFSAASGGTITSDADVTWTSVGTAETYSHWSAWDASVAGNFICSDDLTTPRAVLVGDNFTIATGDIDITLGTIAA